MNGSAQAEFGWTAQGWAATQVDPQFAEALLVPPLPGYLVR
jgi:hypothetical protein